MPRRIPGVIVFVSVCVLARVALGQPAPHAPTATGEQASLREGHVHGLVRDDLGRAVGGVNVVAFGTVMNAARSGSDGRFKLALPPGEYVLRASRDGYVSTYREAIRVQMSAMVERNITLVRAGVTSAVPDPAAADAALTAAVTPAGTADAERIDEAAWRLRHLARIAIRDIAPPTGVDNASRNAASFQPTSSSWLAATDFSGEVNFLTSSSIPASSGWLPAQLPRGIAYVAVSAPVGSIGHWRVQGATGAADMSSWAVLAEYRSSERRRHAFTLGVSYSTEFDQSSQSSPTADVSSSRSVGGLYGFDRWQVGSDLRLDYGLRLDRYDYVSGSTLASPHLGARVTVLPSTYLTALASRRTVAPGADEFLPPPSAGPWLPPERTFAPLVAGTGFTAERVGQYALGLEHRFGGAAAPAVAVERFLQATGDQGAMVFSADAGDAEHYRVAAPGSVDVDGWTVRVSSRLAPHVRGTFDYTRGLADWRAGADAEAIRGLGLALVRPGRERLQDLTAVIEASVPRTSTRLTIVYRASRAQGPTSAAFVPTLANGRFDLEVHQTLPFKPLNGGTSEVLFGVRTLYHDLCDVASLYDELLTLAPPLRVVGGVRLKF